MSSGNSSSGGIGFSTALLMIFIVLKLVGAVDWSWWCVLSPCGYRSRSGSSCSESRRW